MDSITIKLVLIFTIFKVLQINCDGSNRRFLDQLNSFKREVREDLSYIHADISTLFNTVYDLKNSGTTGRQDACGNKTSDKCGKCAVDDKEDIDEIRQVIPAILKALESEKLLNRQLQNKLQALEEENRINRQFRNKLQTFEGTLSDIVLDMDTCVSFMTYMNETLQKPATVSPTVNPDYHDYITSTDYRDSKGDETTTTNVPVSTRKILETSYCTKAKRSGVYGVYLKSINVERSVYCDADTDGGGWVVIMRRQDGSEDFNRTWDDYKTGFGNFDGEFWIGNDIIHSLTKSKLMELRIDMEDYDGNKAYAKYSYFEIGLEAENYILNVEGYSGTAGDSLVNVSHPGAIHNGMAFSTPDIDNDLYKTNSCAEQYSSGWWYNVCFRARLTGKYGDMGSVKKYHGIVWYSWTKWEKYLKYVDMKIR